MKPDRNRRRDRPARTAERPAPHVGLRKQPTRQLNDFTSRKGANQMGQTKTLLEERTP
jgi:hypothetical protein